MSYPVKNHESKTMLRPTLHNRRKNILIFFSVFKFVRKCIVGQRPQFFKHLTFNNVIHHWSYYKAFEYAPFAIGSNRNYQTFLLL